MLAAEIVAVVLLGLCVAITSILMCIENNREDSQVFGLLTILNITPLITMSLMLGDHYIFTLIVLSIISCGVVGLIFSILGLVQLGDGNPIDGGISLTYFAVMGYATIIFGAGLAGMG
jgi:hypothetical protein